MILRMANDTLYLPEYENSWALVIGINNYQHTSPLGYARNDAEVVAQSLTERFDFPPENVTLLFDESATRGAIMSSFLSFAEDKVGPDDRVVVFFAGHGYTRTGKRGEVGYLVPVDGDPGDLSTLIRWDDLTRNAELVAAKHVLFVMDACYGGLAVSRTIPPGSMRFLKDMLQRYARQVLTAGKANELVADAGGPRAGHSIFTGHFLDALDGAAATPDGIITANAVMGYVYDRVSRDQYSRQSPHFGFLDGDGDLVFVAPPLSEIGSDEKTSGDVLIDNPSHAVEEQSSEDTGQFIETLKEYLSDQRYRIRLDDLVTTELRSVLRATQDDRLPLSTGSVSPQDIAERIRSYEHVLARLSSISLLVGRWGGVEQQPILTRIITRLVAENELRGGTYVWLGLRWYPALLELYAAGIGALSAGNYKNLMVLLTTRVASHITAREKREAVVAIVDGMLEAERANAFKNLPGYERYYTPKSEYLFKTLQPLAEDLLFVGRGYEELFDRFEVLLALVYADLTWEGRSRMWGPPGRFAWKLSQGHGDNPLNEMIAEAGREGDAWPPLAAGLFRGSLVRFQQVAAEYATIIGRLNWL